MKYKFVIFDLDGTLVDIPIHYEKLREWLEIGPHDSISEKILQLTDKKLSEFRAYNTEIEKRVVLSKIEMLHKSMDIMSTFAGSVDMGLVTFQGLDLATRIIKYFSWDQHIDYIATRENLTKKDSISCRIEQLMNVIHSFEYALDTDLYAKDILFVGNSLHDFQAAKYIGCYFLGV